MAHKRPITQNMTAEQKAAHHDSGQDQDPIQSREENTGLFDSAQHSSAPGPFGTGKLRPRNRLSHAG